MLVKGDQAVVVLTNLVPFIQGRQLKVSSSISSEHGDICTLQCSLVIFVMRRSAYLISLINVNQCIVVHIYAIMDVISLPIPIYNIRSIPKGFGGSVASFRGDLDCVSCNSRWYIATGKLVSNPLWDDSLWWFMYLVWARNMFAFVTKDSLVRKYLPHHCTLLWNFGATQIKIYLFEYRNVVSVKLMFTFCVHSYHINSSPMQAIYNKGAYATGRLQRWMLTKKECENICFVWWYEIISLWTSYAEQFW